MPFLFVRKLNFLNQSNHGTIPSVSKFKTSKTGVCPPLLQAFPLSIPDSHQCVRTAWPIQAAHRSSNAHSASKPPCSSHFPELPLRILFTTHPTDFPGELSPAPLCSQYPVCTPKTSPYNGVSWLIVCLHHRLSFLPVHYFIPSV